MNDKAIRNILIAYLKASNHEIRIYQEKSIQKLQKNDGTLEFAAIQKLVNMTLKYLIILNECEGMASVFDICEEKCDCPIDSIILERLNKINGNKHECWTKIEEPEYIKVQDEIRAYLREEYPQDTRGNIWFDFLMWKVN